MKRIIATLFIIAACFGASGQEPRLVLPIGHTSEINSVVFSPDGSKIVSASDDKTVKIWDAQTGGLYTDLNFHTGKVFSAYFSPDGKRIVSASEDSTAKVWEVETGVLLGTLKGHGASLITAIFSKDNKTIVTTSYDNTAKIWNAQTFELVATLKGHTSYIEVISFSPDGRQILSGSNDHTARIWDARTGHLLQTLQGHTKALTVASFNANGTKIVTASEDGTSKIWNGQAGVAVTTIKVYSELTSARFMPNVQEFITTNKYDSTARIWDIATGQLMDSIKSCNGSFINSIEFSPDGHDILIDEEYHADLRDFHSSKQLATFPQSIRHHPPPSFSNDGKSIFTIRDNQITVWDKVTGERRTELKGHTNALESCRFSADGQRLQTTFANAKPRVWDIVKGRLLFSMGDKSGYLSFSGDGTRLLIENSDDSARIWNADNGIKLATLQRAPRSGWTKGNLSPDGATVVEWTYEDPTKIWDAKTGKLLAMLKDTIHVEYAAISPGNTQIVTLQNDSSARLWNAKNGSPIYSLKGHMDRIRSVFFSGDGAKVVTCAADQTAKIWDTHTGKLLANLNGDKYEVISASFTADGKKILTVGYESIKVWDVQNGTQIATVDCHDNFNHHGVVSFNHGVISADGKTIIASLTLEYGATFGFHSLCAYDAATGKIIANMDGHTGEIQSINFSPDGNMVATTSSDNTCKIWNAQTFELLYTFLAIDSTDYFFQLTNGYYKCSQNAARLLHFVSDNKIVGFDRFDVKFNRPDKVLEAMGSTDSALISAYKNAYYKRIKKLGVDTSSATVIYTAPKVDFVNRDDINKLQSKNNIILHIQCRDDNYYLSKFNVIVNGSPLFGFNGINTRSRQIHYLDTFISVLLSDGRNSIEASILNSKGIEGDRARLTVNYTPPQTDEKKVYLIGVGEKQFDIDYRKEGSIIYETVYDPVVKIHIIASDSDKQLSGFEVIGDYDRHYGWLSANFKGRNIQSIDTILTVHLLPGRGVLMMTVTDMNESYNAGSRLYFNYVPTHSKMYFIGIGANHFADSTYNLRYCRQDIRALAARLKEKYDDAISIDTLFDDQVTVDKVNSLKKLLLHTNVNDKVIVAYSGHGLLSSDYDYFLSTYNINFHKPEDKGLPYYALENLMDSIPARQKLLLIDACNSGEVDKEELANMRTSEVNMVAKKGLRIFTNDSAKLGMKNTFELMQDLFVNVGKNTGATVVSAAAGTQFALEKNELKNGVFTYSILEFMEQHDHARVSDLIQYLNKRVVELTNGLQTPTARQENLEYDWDVW